MTPAGWLEIGAAWFGAAVLFGIVAGKSMKRLGEKPMTTTTETVPQAAQFAGPDSRVYDPAVFGLPSTRQGDHNALMALIIDAKRNGSHWAELALVQLSQLTAVPYHFATAIGFHKLDVEIVEDRPAAGQREAAQALQFVADKLQQAHAVATRHGLVVAEDIEPVINDCHFHVRQFMLATTRPKVGA